MRRVPWALAALSLSLGLTACGDFGPELSIATPDRIQFQEQVYPVVLRDCAFPACHGNPDRFFRVFGPGRTRISSDVPVFDPATPDERELAYQRAISMINTDDVLKSLLLTKPLDKAAGGSGHEGVDGFTRDVYATQEDTGWATLRAWVETVPPSAVPTGTVPAPTDPTAGAVP